MIYLTFLLWTNRVLPTLFYVSWQMESTLVLSTHWGRKTVKHVQTFTDIRGVSNYIPNFYLTRLNSLNVYTLD